MFFVPWNNTYEPLNYNLCEYDKIGGDMAWGTLMLNRSFEDTTIVNLFETEEYASFAGKCMNGHKRAIFPQMLQ